MKNNILIPLLIVAFIIIGCNKKAEISPINDKIIPVLSSDPLPSWKEGKSKSAIIEFVTNTTKEGGSDFIPIADRIACFDNDGTLWSEQPVYFQFFFAMDQIKLLASEHPEWKTKQPFKAVLEDNMKTLVAGGEHALLEIMMATHAGMTTEEFANEVKNWIQVAKHPKTGKLYKEMVFQPMLELLKYLRANEYKTFIVSGGGIDFIRPWAEEVYGIPPYQIVGSSEKVKYQVVDEKPKLIKLPEINFIDDKEGKPVGIHQYIGKRPVFVAGNSDGDYAMLQWSTTQSTYKSFGMIIHHTDAEREYAYDKDSAIGKLDKALKDASKYNWHIVNMKTDWSKIYTFEK